MYRFIEFLDTHPELLSEAMKKKRMVRDGKPVYKWKTDKPGVNRIEYDEYGNPREVRMTPEEIRNRKKGRKSAISQIEGKRDMIELKKKQSMNVRKKVGLKHYNKKFPDVNSEHDDSKI